MGRITELITGRDGEIRAAKVLLPSGYTVNRPSNFVYPLEVVALVMKLRMIRKVANLEMKPDKYDFNLNRTKHNYEFKNLDNKDTIDNNSENTTIDNPDCMSNENSKRKIVVNRPNRQAKTKARALLRKYLGNEPKEEELVW